MPWSIFSRIAKDNLTDAKDSLTGCRKGVIRKCTSKITCTGWAGMGVENKEKEVMVAFQSRLFLLMNDEKKILNTGHPH